MFPKTPRCPACDSGMDVPGIRHNAECKRKRAAFEASETPSATPVVVPNVARPRLEVQDMELRPRQARLRSAQVQIRLVHPWTLKVQA